MSLDPSFQELRRQGYRLTPQRRAIFQILQQAEGHLTPVEVVARARQAMPGLTEATVYRSLAFLAENGLALATHVGGGQLVYESAERAHHHLICRGCGAEVEVDHEVLHELYARLHEITGYEIDSLHMTFFGRCAHCQGD
jgi:Fe2+ or Zn2+ uptake regulation protein